MHRIHWSLRVAGFAIAASVVAAPLSGPLSVERLATSFAAHVVLAGALALVSAGMPWKLRARVATLFLLVFGSLVVNSAVELSFFSTTETGELFRFVATGGLLSGLAAWVVAWLFPPNTESRGVRSHLSEYFASRGPLQWTWRGMVVLGCYVLFYLVVGGIAFQFTKPYYTDPSFGLNLTVPSLATVVLVECVRGPVFLLSLLPFVAGASYSRRRCALIAGLALFVIGGLAPLLSNTEWPVALRVYHTAEILLQNGPLGIVIGLLFGQDSRTLGKTARLLDTT